jgi:tetratricopeptide (TPR) repeat protein
MLTNLMLSFLLAAAREDLTQLIPRMEHASVTGSVEQLDQCRERLLSSLKASSGRDSELPRYTLAYVDWRLYPLLSCDPANRKRASEYLAEAQTQLKQLIAANPSHAEAHALLSTLYGQEIGSSAWKGMTLGPKSSASIDTAMKLARDNPRVALQAGVGAFFTPKMFGGGIDKAEREIRRAEKLFAKESTNQPWPNWGRLDVLAWMGQVLAAKGDRQGARTYYERALELQPDYGWVRHILLPALDKPAKKK